MHILGYMVCRRLLRNGNRGMHLRYLEIKGGKKLDGDIRVQGSKNAVLPILTSCILGGGVCRIGNCPRISDVEVTLGILKAVGCKVIQEKHTVCVDATDVSVCEIPASEASRTRSSVLFLGALIGRCRKAVLPVPGGCAIGARPVDLHRKALEKLGVTFSGQESMTADGSGLSGAVIHLSFPSVGATENSILAAVLAPGTTVIEQAAQEPEIDELIHFLNLRGARIRRKKDGSIWIEGVKELYPVKYTMQADRIVVGTYLLGAVSAGGRVRVLNYPKHGLELPMELFREMGAVVRMEEESCELKCSGRPKALSYLETAPYPGFPTDLQSLFTAVLACADGRSRIRETIFENRFQMVQELKRMGAQIEVYGNTAWIQGIPRLQGAEVSATDLRSGAGLVLAGLGASDVTRVRNVEYIERGYEDICRDFGRFGADIQMCQ